MAPKIAGLGLGIVALCSIGTNVSAETCPWPQTGQGDVIGASRTQSPEKAMEGLRLVRSGKVYELAHDYDEATIPKPFDRLFDVTISPFDVDPAGPSQVFNQGTVNGHIGQVGTQFDGLAHAGHDLGFYNCIPLKGMRPDDTGRLRMLDVASVNPFFTRAILLDFVHHSDVPKVTVNGRSIVKDSYVIAVNDVERVLASQLVDPPGRGDVVLFYTGWDSLFGVDDKRHFSSPGPGVEVASWLADRDVALVGSDTQAVEALTDGLSVELKSDPNLLGKELGPIVNAVHFILLTQNGIHLLEHLNLGALAEELLAAQQKGERPYEFLFVFAPLPITGLEGSPGQPLAVR